MMKNTFFVISDIHLKAAIEHANSYMKYAILFRKIVMYQDNNLNVIKNDKDEQLVKQKVNPINGFLNEKKELCHAQHY